MTTLRRLYLYAVAFVSLETVIWGLIGLARAYFVPPREEVLAATIATSLSLFLVGLPVFIVHWYLAQRGARANPQERSARLRAVFLYGALLATLLPAQQDTLALIERTLAQIFGLPGGDLGSGQALVDNLSSILANGLAAAWVLRTQRSDWIAGPQDDEYANVRRLHRHFWLIYGLGLAVAGASEALAALIRLPAPGGDELRFMLSAGLARLLVGAPIWLLSWRILQHAWQELGERQASTRLVALTFLLVAAAGATLVSAYGALRQALLLLVGGLTPGVEFLRYLSPPLGSLLPLGLAWGYARRLLAADLAAQPVETGAGAGRGRFARLLSGGALSRLGGRLGGLGAAAQLRRSLAPARLPELRRLVLYALALFGLAGCIYGLHELLAVGFDRLAGTLDENWRRTLSQGLAALVVGLPTWLVAWTRLSREATLEGEAGERARRTVFRRAFLYASLFAGVIGAMFSMGALVYQLVRAALGAPEPNLLVNSLQQLKAALLFALLGVFHGAVMRQDAQVAERVVRRRQAQFPLLLLAPDEGEFADVLVAALSQEAPGVPVAVHPYSQGAPDETLSAARAVVLPVELLARPSEALRLWLQGFAGPRLVLPTPVEGWQWITGDERPLRTLARQCARQVRMLAEGERDELRLSGAWQTAVLVIGVIAGLALLIALVNLAAAFSP